MLSGFGLRPNAKKQICLTSVQAHGLRKAGATILANSGASSYELMAMYGWSKSTMAEKMRIGKN
ncbi:hypothetical protein CKC_04450 [Candidatus Liberibacter solanacearum CLso-ZC1]|uniref:Uncharacterized protein n=1 Tax=Liberibacter solanacearum (strain CLso-ZC1) TaxID=658172 RepID=E4UDG1_LIBSC|nr:hypothetical protein CKC_04450 [Candidatus Liberibacter solanacearum CLso-ZC1]